MDTRIRTIAYRVIKKVKLCYFYIIIIIIITITVERIYLIADILKTSKQLK